MTLKTTTKPITNVNNKTILNPSKPKRGPCKGIERRVWTDDEVALLGVIPDKQVAARIGRDLGAVQMKRRKMGIQSFSRNQIKPDYYLPVEYLPLLALVSESSLLQLLGWDNPHPIRAITRSLGGANFTVWTPAVMSAMSRHTPVEICHQTGILQGTIRSRFKRLGIANPTPNLKTIEVEWSLPLLMRLGSSTDEAMVIHHAVPRKFTRQKRAELGLEYDPRWTYDAHRMLPYVPVKSISSTFCLPINDIKARAKLLSLDLAPPLSGETVKLPNVHSTNQADHFVRTVKQKKAQQLED